MRMRSTAVMVIGSGGGAVSAVTGGSDGSGAVFGGRVPGSPVPDPHANVVGAPVASQGGSAGVTGGLSPGAIAGSPAGAVAGRSAASAAPERGTGPTKPRP